MYDSFSTDYDRFVNWKNRLGFESPFLFQQLALVSAGSPAQTSVLDSACGTAMHAIALAQAGYRAAGADLSAGMIAKARANALAAGLDLLLLVAGFGEMAPAFRGLAVFPFDALLCMGNSLPHLLSLPALRQALEDFAACLKSDGLLLIQNRNFDAVSGAHDRWMEPQAHREGNSEWVFVRFYDFLPDGLIDFNILTLRRDQEGEWKQSLTTTRLRPLLQADLLKLLGETGFTDLKSYGGMQGSPFDPQTSGNLVVTARKR